MGSVFRAVGSIFGGGGSPEPPPPPPPQEPVQEATGGRTLVGADPNIERVLEQRRRMQRQRALVSQGQSRTVLGG